jgi:3-deoxy-D-manno-octulosonic-acid transferase
MFIAYSLLLAIALLLSLPWWIIQMLRHGKYRAGIQERLGRVPGRLRQSVEPGGVWIHAVSVGEVLAISNLVKELEAAYPGIAIYVSTTTLTGQQLARTRFGAHRCFFLPMDFVFSVSAYLNLLRPRLLVLAETELWPNLLHRAHSRGTRVAVVNARISDRSFPRYRKFHRFLRPMLAQVDLFLAQTEEDARRLALIGAPSERVHVSGNLKFDVRAGAATPIAEELRRAIPAGTLVLVCGSTTEGEEELLLAAFQALLSQIPAAIMIMAPRHPERFEKVASLISASGIPWIRRSAWAPSNAIANGVFLLDSVGELASIYSLADIAFVGGSLVPVGGHNILEPAQYGVALLTGPHTFNFREIVRIFEDGGGMTMVTAENLSQELLKLASAPQMRKQMGQRARDLFMRHAGATRKTREALQPLLENR